MHEYDFAWKNADEWATFSLRANIPARQGQHVAAAAIIDGHAGNAGDATSAGGSGEMASFILQRAGHSLTIRFQRARCSRKSLH